MDYIDITISASISMISLGLLVLAIISYRKYHNFKMLVLGIVFLLLLIKGILFTVTIFYPDITVLNDFLFSRYSGMFDVLMLISLFVATMKR